MAEEKRIEGLGGWLILVGLGIIISPLRIISQAFPLYLDWFKNGTWSALTTPGTETYNPFWAPILIGEIAINCGLALAWIFIAFLFFSKKKMFKKWYIGILLFVLVFILIDSLAMKLIFPADPIFDADIAKDFFRTLVITLIFVPYMMVSKRVNATFIK